MKKLYFFIFFLSALPGYSQTNIFDISRKGTLDDIVKIYNSNPEVIHQTNESGYTPLILACYYSNEKIAEFLIDKIDDINGTSDYGTPLMAAVVKGNYNIVKMLLEKNADTNIADANGTTALHYAVMFKNYDLIKLLLEANADLNKKDNRGQSALDYATIYNDKKLNNLLNNI